MLDCNRILLTGPPSSGKTSLLFRQALHWSELGGAVLFVVSSPLSSLPLIPLPSSSSSSSASSVSLPHPDPQVLSRIHFKYPTGLNELLHLLSTLHIPPSSDINYQSIVVDDIHKFMTQGKPANLTGELSQVCAYIIDAAKYLEKHCENEMQEAHTAHVAVSLSTHLRNAESMVDVGRRWISQRFIISPQTGNTTFTITNPISGTAHLHYKLTHPYLQIMPTT